VKRRTDRRRNLKPFGRLEVWILAKDTVRDEFTSQWEPLATFQQRWAAFGAPCMDLWASQWPDETPEALEEGLADPAWARDNAPWAAVRFGVPDGWRAEGAVAREEAAMEERRRLDSVGSGSRGVRDAEA
jgi:hypothetical protein